MAKATNVKVDLQSGTDRTAYATWTWTKKNTDNYSVVWYYSTGDGVWFIGTESTVTAKQSVYSAPGNATKVKFKVKPISKLKVVNDKETTYWTASWSTQVQYNFSTSNPPSIPAVPLVTINKYVLLAEVDDYDSSTLAIEFQVVKDNAIIFSNGKASKITNHASFSCNITAGSQYKVRCRSIGKNENSGWSEYSTNIGTIPYTPNGITKCVSTSISSVRVEWSPVSLATTYDVEYTTNKNYFDSSNQTQSITVNSVVNYAEISGLESGKEWFFRVRAANSQGESGWCSPKSIIIGKIPAAPTTWSTTTTAVVGNTVTLYWIHNSEDGSNQTNAQLELNVNGTVQVITLTPTVIDGENSNSGSYILNTTVYTEGAKIKWRVRTKGIINQYGDWSVQRAIDIYAPPTLQMTMGDGNIWFWDTFNFNIDTIYTADGMIDAVTNVLLHFPYFIKMVAGPASQQAIGYSVSITATEAYETLDQTGKKMWINEGEVIYTKNIDRRDNDVTVYLNASEIDLENNITYKVDCLVSMDSGLTATASDTFIVNWEDQEYEPDAEIGYDKEKYVAYIRPFCVDDEDNLIDDILLSVYRREFDGTFVELAKDIENLSNTYITDPHPSLDYARYRIVAISKTTGSISYYDAPGYPVGEIGAIIQWNEEWTSFDTLNEDAEEKPTWSGSLLRLPYNIQVSDSHDQDVSLVEYIGRKHPVSYYGTQLGETRQLNVDIVKTDEDTLYAIRRLAIWMGDVYVREPSGSGYWAQIKVSYSQKYKELTIPISFDITRVDGGV